MRDASHRLPTQTYTRRGFPRPPVLWPSERLTSRMSSGSISIPRSAESYSLGEGRSLERSLSQGVSQPRLQHMRARRRTGCIAAAQYIVGYYARSRLEIPCAVVRTPPRFRNGSAPRNKNKNKTRRSEREAALKGPAQDLSVWASISSINGTKPDTPKRRHARS